MYTHIEDYIIDLYKFLGISHPEQISIEKISLRLGIDLSYGTVSLRDGNSIMIRQSNKQKEWQLFGHEICHYLRHCGHQLNMHPMFRDLQEYQADYFAYHFCVPTFMLDHIYNYNAIDIASLFNVEFDFALTRLEMYQNKFYGEMNYYAGAYRKAW